MRRLLLGAALAGVSCGSGLRSDVTPRVASHVHLVLEADDPSLVPGLAERLRQHGFRVITEMDPGHRRRGVAIRVVRATSPRTAADCLIQATLVSLAPGEGIIERLCTTATGDATERLFEGIRSSRRLRAYVETGARLDPTDDSRIVR